MFQFSLARPSVELVLWCIDDRTLALALLQSQLDTVPAQPRQGLNHLPIDLRHLLETRIDPGASAWVVGVFEERTRGVLNVLPLVKRDGMGWLASLRGLAGWVQVQEQVRTGASLHFQDEAAASRQEERLRKLEGANPELKLAREGSWLILQYQTNLEAVLRTLAR